MKIRFYISEITSGKQDLPLCLPIFWIQPQLRGKDGSHTHAVGTVESNRLRYVMFVGEGANATGLHSLEFRNFAMVLSDSQVELLALTLEIEGTDTSALVNQFREEFPSRMNRFMGLVMRGPLAKNSALRTQPCAWNMLLSRRCVLH